MKITQLAPFLQSIESEVFGTNEIIKEDLSNIVDLGMTIKEFGDKIISGAALDKYVKAIVNKTGKTLFHDSIFKANGVADLMLRDSWEYGSILEKISIELPEEGTNQSWELVDGQSYDYTQFKAPGEVTVKMFNQRETYDITVSYAKKLVLESFKGVEDSLRFFTMIENSIRNKITTNSNALALRLVNAMIAETFNHNFSDGDYTNKSSVNCINVLHLYKVNHPDSNITTDNMLEDKEFLRFFSRLFSETKDNLTYPSRLFNIDSKVRETSKERQRAIILNKVDKACRFNLYSDTWHETLVELDGKYTVVPFWQGSGTDYSLHDTGEINVVTSNGAEVEASVIMGVLFDSNGLAICNENVHTEAFYNPVGEFVTYAYRPFSNYFADTAEQFVVFYAA